MFFADERTVVIARASLARTPLQSHFSSDQVPVEHRRTGRGTRCDRERHQGSLGRFGFALKNGLSAEEKSRFQKVFLEQQFAEWIRSVLGTGQSNAEAVP